MTLIALRMAVSIVRGMSGLGEQIEQEQQGSSRFFVLSELCKGTAGYAGKVN